MMCKTWLIRRYRLSGADDVRITAPRRPTKVDADTTHPATLARIARPAERHHEPAGTANEPWSDEIIETVIVHADRLQVTINGAPPLTVALSEVGLREPVGMRPDVSEGGLEPPHSCLYQPLKLARLPFRHSDVG